MTSSQESSKQASAQASGSDVESLAGLFHPHAIEVQDFSYYALVIDVRSQSEFDDDHIPGAVRFPPVDLPSAAVAGARMSAELTKDARVDANLPPALATLVAPVKLDRAILVYCGREGRDSLPIAKALRWRGWTVDVLPGGWINYRRWVQAGLEALPRLIAFRAVTAALSGETARVLEGLSKTGQQVLDVEAIAGWRSGAFVPVAAQQPAQAWFDSQLLQAMRHLDPRLPVWMADADRQLGAVTVPSALADALAVAPMVSLACPRSERLARWREDEPLLNAGVEEILHAAATTSPAPEPLLVAAWGALSDPADLIAGLLNDRDQRWLARQAGGRSGREQLPALVARSLEPDRLVEAIREWLPSALAADPG